MDEEVVLKGVHSRDQNLVKREAVGGREGGREEGREGGREGGREEERRKRRRRQNGGRNGHINCIVVILYVFFLNSPGVIFYSLGTSNCP